VDSTIPADAMPQDHPTDAEPSSPSSPASNVIRMVRSPSKHRNYGQTAEGSARPSRSLSVSKLAKPVIGIEEEEMDDQMDNLKMSSNTKEAEVDEAQSAVTISNAKHEQNDAIPTSQRVPVIRIQIPSGDAAQKSLENTTPTYTPSDNGPHVLIMGEESQDRRDHTSTGASLRRNIGEQLNLITDTSAISLPVSDDETPVRVFEAFPTLNGIRWFSSVKFAIVSCVLTSVMIIATIIYNIIQAVHNGGQTASP